MTRGSSGSAVGVDVGGTKVLGVAVDAAGDIRARARRPTPHVRTPDLGRALAQTVAEVVGALADEIEIEPGALTLGVGLPGMVDRAGTLFFAPNLPSASGADLSEELRTMLDAAVVHVGNDADCAAIAEHRHGAAVGHHDVVVVTLGTGIGGGAIVDGQLVRGGQGFAGEIGHMVLDVNGPPCPCGSRGCWERYASGSGLGRLAREAATAGALANVVTSAGGDPESVRGEHVTAAALDGDPEAIAVFDQCGWWLARGLANLACVLDPSCMVIGGGLSEAASLLVPSARRHLAGMLEGGATRPAIEVVGAAFGSEAGAVGAAIMAREAV